MKFAHVSKRILGVGLVVATMLGNVATTVIAKEKVDWGKVAWSPVKPTSPWPEWQFDPKKAGRTWKYTEELTAAEKEYWQVDPRWAHEIPRDKEYPYLPAERYPFKPPYSGEEISAIGEAGGGGSVMCGLQTHHGVHLSRKKDKQGVLSKSESICNTIKHFKTFAQLLYELKPGSEQGAYLTMTLSPPESSGNVTLSKFYTDGPGVTKLEDRWGYTRQQRRVRRTSGASGEDYLPGGTSTYDDTFLRAFWKYDSKVIGVDILYESAAKKKPYGPINGPYRKDGGIECYVVLSKHYDKNYYLSQWITWYEKKSLAALRVEQWDRRGNFKQVSEKAPYSTVSFYGKDVYVWEEAMKGGLTANGAERRAILHGELTTLTWDAEQDVLSFGLPDVPNGAPKEKFGPLEVYAGGETWKELFQPQRLEQPFLKPQPKVNFTINDFPSAPQLYREKFAKVRKINLPKEIAARVKQEEQSKRKLF